jgi:hypothetical protein
MEGTTLSTGKPMTLEPGIPSASESESKPAEDSEGGRQSLTSTMSMKHLYHRSWPGRMNHLFRLEEQRQASNVHLIWLWDEHETLAGDEIRVHAPRLHREHTQISPSQG